MMPALAMVSLSRTRWLPPLPLPLFMLWPLVLTCLGVARVIENDRPREAATLRAAMEVFRQLRGLSIDLETPDHRPLRVWFV